LGVFGEKTALDLMSETGHNMTNAIAQLLSGEPFRIS
jgi:hypothetical protein